MKKEGIKHKTFCWQRAIIIFSLLHFDFMWKSLNRIDQKEPMRISRLRGTGRRERKREKEKERKKRNRTKNKRRTTTATTTMNDNDKETFNYPIMKNAFIATTTTTQYIFPFAIFALGKYWFAASLFPFLFLSLSLSSASLLLPRLVWIHLSRWLINVVNVHTGNVQS